MTGRIASKLTMNSQCTHWVSDPLPPVCVARDALLCLDPCGDWQKLYLILTNNDNQGPGKEPEEMLGSNGQYTLSWIWHLSTTSVSPDEVNEDMHTEWAQCTACADRWEEEVLLLREEMRRVVEFLEWRSSDWFAKTDSRSGAVTPAVYTGLSAYASKQGSVFHNLALRFSQRWCSALTTHSLPHTWATVFLDACKQSLDNPDPEKHKPTGDPPITHTNDIPPPPISIPPPTTPKASHCDDLVTDISPDGTSSECSELEYGSDSSYSE